MKKAYWRMRKWGKWPNSPFTISDKKGKIRVSGDRLIPDEWLEKIV